MGRLFALLYGVITYVVMFGSFLYLFAFMANVLVPKTIDSGESQPLAVALGINLVLILVFGLSHSVMARPGFKKWWTRFVPETVERTTYVLVATVITILIFWLWVPMTQVVWDVSSPMARNAIWGIYILGIVILLASTFIIDHFDLFGLRQVYLNFIEKPYSHLDFKVTFFYKFVRHPLYVGWFLIFWTTPTMTVGHLVFALGMSAYILIAIGYEERDLVHFHGGKYENYRARVPMLVPSVGKIHETVKPQKSFGAA